MRTLVWFRGKDLRLADHAPLTDAAKKGPFACVFVLDPFFFDERRARELPHRMQFLLESLTALERNLAQKGSKLLVVAGKSVEVIPSVAERLRVDRVVAHRWVEPFGRERDRRVERAMRVPLELFEGETLAPPGSQRSGQGTPFAVFSAFARALHRSVSVPAPLRVPTLSPPFDEAASLPTVPIPTCEALGLTRNPRLQPGGERAANERLARFVGGSGPRYPEERNRMDLATTSRLSADLKFGTLSVRKVWTASMALPPEARRVYQNELLWREFAHHTLFDRPELLERPFRLDFAGFPYRDDEALWRAWTDGQTGYPIVDASARQLLGEGFVHNRARMISASFLTKHLLVDFRRGEAHYMKWLTDGDWAQNDMGWQWSAGSGCDAQPYFRVFNPVTQGEKFDPSGDYVRRWVPELAKMPAKYIHAPWSAPPRVLADAGVRLGRDYPLPVVDHAKARARFLSLAKAHLGRASR